ncbi:MAG: 50S ribosomal protein L10 [Arsenophonus sp. ET-LJ4-MAG3]
MALNLQKKQVIIAEIKEIIESALSLVIADFHGVSVEKMTKLRKEGREAEVYLRIVRNTLLRRIVKDSVYECLKEMFIGPTLIAFSKEHPGAAARLFKEFAKENQTFKIKAAIFEGALIPANEIDRLATLPTYKEAIMRLISTIKEASAGKLIRIIAILRDQKEAN